VLRSAEIFPGFLDLFFPIISMRLRSESE